MIAKITTIQEDELEDVVTAVQKCNGTVVGLFVSFDDEDVKQADVEISDLGYDVLWND